MGSIGELTRAGALGQKLVAGGKGRGGPVEKVEVVGEVIARVHVAQLQVERACHARVLVAVFDENAHLMMMVVTMCAGDSSRPSTKMST